jgi:hypothetical protein
MPRQSGNKPDAVVGESRVLAAHEVPTPHRKSAILRTPESNLRYRVDPFVEATSAALDDGTYGSLTGILAGKVFRGGRIVVGRQSVISSPLGGRTITERPDTTLTPLGAQPPATSGNRETRKSPENRHLQCRVIYRYHSDATIAA